MFMKSSVYLSLMLFFFSLILIINGHYFYLETKSLFLEIELFSYSGVDFIYLILLDWMSLTFFSAVLFISSMVLMYSTSYMDGDKNFNRFIFIVFLFVVSMVFLIISPNLISVLLGWDGLGLVSYCLVIYYQNVKSYAAGMLTVLSNRVGDVAILLSIAWGYNFGAWNFSYIEHYLSLENGMYWVMGLIILAAMTKSAQIPFSAWLPAAMAAPTPVSALVHSSTLVTAGVYLLIRFNNVLGINSFIFYISCFTMFMSGLGANFETDLKKIIALSTLSQLGVMMMILSLGMFELSFFHLITHAMFKSLLFLCAGSYIHVMFDTQDIRHLSNVSVNLPLTSIYFVGCSLSLCGFPFLAGFYSKDMILEFYFMSSMNNYMYVIVMMGTMFTMTYSIRLLYYLYFNPITGGPVLSSGETFIMLFPMTFLFFFAVTVGSWMGYFFVPPVSIFMPFLMKISVLFGVLFFGVLVLKVLSSPMIEFYKNMSNSVHFMGSMWWMPNISTIYPSRSLILGNFFLKYFDSSWLEYYSGQGVFKTFTRLGFISDYFNNLNLKSYLFVISYLVFVFTMIF
uniref:NADH dehydrogenase subunit 5 n=1 Tax=Spinactaletes boneti TaxID=2736147 RepID=UPI001EE0B2DF|nr:NADH dehydrogenase subunit 5 [Spinactaletes boneti]UJY98023.1 NADH dehydrogenase subunit 5 [Spinactaletes boneti]